jgi:hypothetical protein
MRVLPVIQSSPGSTDAESGIHVAVRLHYKFVVKQRLLLRFRRILLGGAAPEVRSESRGIVTAQYKLDALAKVNGQKGQQMSKKIQL